MVGVSANQRFLRGGWRVVGQTSKLVTLAERCGKRQRTAVEIRLLLCVVELREFPMIGGE